MNIRMKRAYEVPAENDGYRILVDRVWPRGRSRQDLRIDEWAPSVAPSADVRRWFGHQPERWDAFRDRYRRELAAADRVAELDAILGRVGSKSLTLVYGARDTEHNQAVVLAEVLRDLAPPASNSEMEDPKMPHRTDEEAVVAIKAHHVELRDGLRERVLALRSTIQVGMAHGEAQQAVLDYLEGELLPHAAAEEEALYPAGDTGMTALLVRAMRDEHRNLVAHVTGLKEAVDGVEAATTASAILALFESHLSKENDLLLPALVADPGVSLGELLGGMHELVG